MIRVVILLSPRALSGVGRREVKKPSKPAVFTRSLEVRLRNRCFASENPLFCTLDSSLLFLR